MDVVALAQFDVGYAVATLGTATTPVHVSKLLRLADELVFCFDGDAAGRKAAWRALEVSLALAPDHKPIRFLFLPDGEDPDTFVRKHGKGTFEIRVRESETLSQFLLAQLRSENDLATPEGRARLVTVARPLVQRMVAPALRVQLVNEIAALARISDSEAGNLLQSPKTKHFSRAAGQRPSHAAPRYPEAELLFSLLSNLALAEHVNPALLASDREESGALIAVRDACRDFEAVPSIGLLLDRLQGSEWVEVVLRAQRYGEEVGFDPEEASNEFTQALANLELARRRKELDDLRGRLSSHPGSKEDLVAFNEKNLAYKRLQGALPSH
jgi:DNA primase